MTIGAIEKLAFGESILAPIRSALGGTDLRAWIEREAERYAELGRSGSCIELNSRLREALRIKDVVRHEYAGADSAPLHPQVRQTGSIFLTDGGHRVSVLRAGGTAHIRALEAHEFGHALLFSDQRVWRLLSRRGLLVDPAAERLADDAGRALVLPQSLLLECLGKAGAAVGSLAGQHHLWKHLPRITRLTILPYRIVATRLAPLLLEGDAALLCYTLPRQWGLFESPAKVEGGSERLSVEVRWIMRYSWFSPPNRGREYFFADAVAVSRRTLIEGEVLELADEPDLRDLPPAAVQRIVGEENWGRISAFQKFTRVAMSAYDEKVRHFILCR
jgi:hypothetical protein